MSGPIMAAESGNNAVALSGGNLTLVVVVGVIAVVALGMGAMFRQQVLSAGEGTENMQTIAKAVQEGAAAYLTRQINTLAAYVAIAFVLQFLLPASFF